MSSLLRALLPLPERTITRPLRSPTEISESISWLHSSNCRPVWRRNCTMAYLRFPSWLLLPLAQEGILICFSPLFKGKVRDASASAQREHKGGKWVFSELKNEPVLSHFYCITSCLLAHCLFGRFFWRPFPYTQVEATPLWRTHGESSPLSKETSRVCAQKALASAGVCQTLVVRERGLTCRHRLMGLYQASTILR